MALVWSVERFHVYLLGREFDLVTNHKPLEIIYSPKSKPSARIERWVLQLQPYHFHIIYKPGKENITDTLSRLPYTDEGKNFDDTENYVNFITMKAVPKAMSAKEIEEVALNDKEMECLRQAVQTGRWEGTECSEQLHVANELCVVGGILMRGTCIVIPKGLRTTVLTIGHEGHLGVVSMKQHLRTKVWWPKLEKDVERFFKTCEACQLVGRPDPPETVASTELLQGPWCAVTIDYLGLLPSGEHILVVVDYYSRYYKVAVVRTITSEKTIECLETIFARHRLPEVLVSDNGPNLVSEKFEAFLKENGIKHRRVTTRWAQANGEVERQNRSILKRLQLAHADDNKTPLPDFGPVTSEEDIVYDSNTDSSSFLPVNDTHQQEIDFIRNNLSQGQINWPTLGNSPLNEYVTPYLATMAFPTLFPDGKGDPTNPAILQNATLKEKVKHLIKFAEKKDSKWIYRFANHPRFSYWALNMIQCKQILQQTGFFLKQNPGEQHLTMEELREMVNNNNTNLFLNKLSRYVTNITGSDAYWYKAKEDLKAIIQHAGPPTFFFTFSAADMHWPELHFLFGNERYEGITGSLSEIRRNNVINNPHIVDWFFTERLKKFIKHWLYDSLDAKWHWYRFEYQSRGSIHCHGVAKLNNDPGLCKLSETALNGYLTENSKDNATSTIVNEGKMATKKICQYVDWLLSTCNPNPPDNSLWIKPSIHPCQEYHKNIKDSDNDYIDLLNMVQRHTRCSTSYWLRKKHNETEPECRFNFPFETCTKTSLHFELIHSKDNTSKYKVQVTTKRNDSRVNNNQRFQLQGWRANCDIQIVIDYYACVEYLAKYAAKSETKSHLLKQAFSTIVHNSQVNTNASSIIKKTVMKTLGQRDFSAQETMHHLLSLNLLSSSFNVVPITLNGSRRLNITTQPDDRATTDSLLDAYAERDKYQGTVACDLCNLNFLQFAMKYRLVNGKLVDQPDNVVPRVYPTYSSNPKSTNFGLYCKYQLLTIL